MSLGTEQQPSQHPGGGVWLHVTKDPSSQEGVEKKPIKPFVLALNIRTDIAPATEQDDDPTIQWGDWSGKNNYE